MRMRVLTASIAAVLAGCQSPPEEPVVAPEPLNIRTAPTNENSPPTYTSRYVKENRAPSSQLTDIFGVPVEVRIPVMSQMSLKEGMNFVLKGSGIKLREPKSYAEKQMYAQPLPLSQTSMGNLSLRDALQVMGGEAFVLEEDVVTREVGFRLRDGYVWDDPDAPVNTDMQDLKTALHEHLALAEPSNESVTMSPVIAKKLSKPETDNLADVEVSLSENSTLKSEQVGKEHLSKSLDHGELFVGSGKTSASSSGSKPNDAAKVSKPLPPKVTYRVNVGESYREALTRWAHKDKYDRIAFAQEPEFLRELDAVAEHEFTSSDMMVRAISKLASEVPELQGLAMQSQKKNDLIAFHPWGKQKVTAFMVDGSNLKEAAKGVVEHYQWKWDDKRSWPGKSPEITPYPIVTKSGDISAALQILLSRYSFKAQRVDAIKTIYFQETPNL